MAPKVSLVSLQALRSLSRQPACQGGCPVDRQTLSGTEAQVLAVTSSRCVSVTAERVWVRIRVSRDSRGYNTGRAERRGFVCSGKSRKTSQNQ